MAANIKNCGHFKKANNIEYCTFCMEGYNSPDFSNFFILETCVEDSQYKDKNCYYKKIHNKDKLDDFKINPCIYCNYPFTVIDGECKVANCKEYKKNGEKTDYTKCINCLPNYGLSNTEKLCIFNLDEIGATNCEKYKDNDKINDGRHCEKCKDGYVT